MVKDDSYKPEVSIPPPDDDDGSGGGEGGGSGGGGEGGGGGGGGGGGCDCLKCAFTEAFKGSSMEPLVDFLRSIRDNGLKRTTTGRLFVNSYERIYYRITQEVVKVVMKNHRFKNFWKKLVAGPVVYFLTGIVKIISTMRHRTMKLVNTQSSHSIIY